MSRVQLSGQTGWFVCSFRAQLSFTRRYLSLSTVFVLLFPFFSLNLYYSFSVDGLIRFDRFTVRQFLSVLDTRCFSESLSGWIFLRFHMDCDVGNFFNFTWSRLCTTCLFLGIFTIWLILFVGLEIMMMRFALLASLSSPYHSSNVHHIFILYFSQSSFSSILVDLFYFLTSIPVLRSISKVKLIASSAQAHGNRVYSRESILGYLKVLLSLYHEQVRYSVTLDPTAVVTKISPEW